MQAATEFQNSFGLESQPDGAIGHEREAHAVAWLHAEAVAQFLGYGDFALTGYLCDVGHRGGYYFLC